MANETQTFDPIRDLSDEDLNALAIADPSFDISTGKTKAEAPAFNPIKDLSAEDLSDLASKDPSFDISTEFFAVPDLHGDPALVQKVADARNIVRKRGFQWEDMPSLSVAASSVAKVAEGLGKQIWNYASGVGNVVQGAIADVVGARDFASESINEASRLFAENIAGTEEAVTGFSQLGGKIVGKALRGAGISKSLDELTPEERVADLWADVGKAEIRQQRLAGQGPFSMAVTGGASADANLDPEDVAIRAAGDPFSFYLFGAAGKLAGAAVPLTVRTAVSGATQAATKAAGTALRVGGGKVVEGIGKAVGGTAGLVEKAAPIVTPITGAVKGGALFGPPGVLGGLAAGQQAGKAIAGIAKSGYVRRPAASIADFGKQVASSEPVRSAYAQAGRDFLQTLPGATFDVAKGTALDIGLAAASAETPADTEGAIGFGTVLGGLQGAAKIGGRVLSGQLIAPREYGVSTPQPSSNSFRALDALHDEAFATAAPGVQARLNAMRQFLSGVAPGADLFFSDNPAKLATALEPAGLSPEQAKTWSAQNGFFSVALRDDAGKPRRVVVVTRPDSAPHEALHIIQDVIGEPGNQAIDQLIKESYAEQWNQIGEDYANRMGAKPGDTWQETILDVSGKGSTMAKEKLYRETRNKLEAEQGAVPNPKLVTEIATEAYGQLMDDAVKNNPHLDPNEVGSKVWRDILKDSPEDINVSADTYIAREIAADTFDAVFKHTGPSLGDPNSLLSKLARIAGRVVTAFGGEPLSGRAGGLSGTRLSTLAVEAVSKTAKGLVPGGTREAPPTVGRVPTSPVEEAATASNLAAAAPEFPTERGTMSQREMLGKVAESIAGRDGVRINYLSAPGEPAAATTSNRATRRAIIEEYRSLPQAARVFGEKTFFPERVRKTKDGKYQVFGWAPEVFAANAHKMAGFLVSHPEFSPYALDPAANTFTPAAWQELYKDTQTYVQNQKTGHTGSGEPLVVPKSMTERGFTAPPLRAGQALPLDQNKADFINLLFHAKLPETPRIQKGKTPLNVAGQEVSVATIPGRVEVPVRPRGEYTGAEAERQGIAGREIAEVNPLRNQIEAAALADKKPMPSLIEANQMLNLENIKELELAPEQPEFRANTLTLQAGFDPKAAMESLKNLPDAEWREQIGNYKGKFGSGLTGWAFEIGSQAKTAEDLQAFRSTGEFLSEAGRTAMKARQFDKAMPLITRSQAASEAFEAATGTKLDGTPKDTAKFIREHYDPTYEYPMPDAGRSDSQAQFDPKSAMEENKNLSDTEWQEKIGNHTGKFGSGFTGWAFEIGSQAKTAEDLQAFRSTAEFLSEAGTTAMKTGQFDKAMQLISRSQAAKEAYEAATGTKVDGTAKDVAKFIREHYDPAYEYPMPSKSNTGDKSAQFDWKVFEDDSRGTEFSTIRSGASIGQTFNRDGSVWDRGEEQVDVVTLANLKMPQDMLTSEAFVEALKPYRKLLEESAVKVSVFSFTEDGNLMVSLDINAIVPQEFRDNSMKFAKANDQTMIWDAVNNDSVATGGKGEAKLTKPKEMLEALDSLVAGKKADVAQIKRKYIEDPSFVTAASGGKAKAPGELPFSRMRSPVREEDEDKEAQFEPQAEETEEFPFSKIWTLPNGDPILQADAQGMKALPFAQFDPKAKGKVKRDLKLKEGPGLFSKAWILPNGEPVQLGGTWHHDWLSKNPEVAKRYGLEIPPFEGGDAEGVRESALKKGFVRVNYGKNNGELTVEARAKDWRGKKDVVQDLIEKNLGRIDRVRVTLLDEKAAGVVDSMTSSLFNLDTNAEKMEAIPFITTGEIRGAQFDPQGFKDEDFPVALKRIRSGQESGQTFNTDGTVWNRGEDLVDIVTLASVNVPQGKLTPETFKKALAPFSDLLEEAGIKAGVFSFSQDGNPMVSIDVNAVVPQEFRKNSVDFARANDQIAIWDAVNNKTIDAGGKGNTQLTKPNEMLDAVDSLIEGKKVDVAEIKRQYAEDTTGAKEEQGTFSGEGREYVGNAAVANMTKAQLAEAFPEVLIPRRRADRIPSAIVDSPLYKQAGSEAKAVEEFARRLVEFANEYKDDPAFKAGVEWYSKFVPKLKKEFGKDAQIMAELLAATSPQTNVQVNFAYAFDALQSLKAGRFDNIIPKFNEGWGLLDSGKWEAEYGKMRDAGEILKPPATPTPAAFLEGWINKYNLKPRQSNGALYGAHSIPVLQVFARKWLTESRGPKTLNFVKNLLGQGHAATIDIWADRSMRRVGYSGFVNRWRILPGNVQAVSAADFSFAQKAFSRAAEQLDMKPDAFQGGLWFAEKKLWHDKGWGRLDLGDFQVEMKKIPALRKRYQQRMAVTDRGPVEQTPDLFAVEPRFAPR